MKTTLVTITGLAFVLTACATTNPQPTQTTAQSQEQCQRLYPQACHQKQ